MPQAFIILSSFPLLFVSLREKYVFGKPNINQKIHMPNAYSSNKQYRRIGHSLF